MVKLLANYIRQFQPIPSEDSEEGRSEEGNPTFWKANKTLHVISGGLLVIAIGLSVVGCYCSINVPRFKLVKNVDDLNFIICFIVLIIIEILLFLGYRGDLGASEEQIPKVGMNANVGFFIIILIIHLIMFFVYFSKTIFVYIFLFAPILHFFAIVIPSFYDMEDYTPFDEKCSHFIQTRAFEESGTLNKSLTVKESGPFRIVVKNISSEAIHGIRISRSDEWRCRYKGEFAFSRPLQPGQSVVIVPETCNEPGALKAIGYRSFGPNKSLTIRTQVFPCDCHLPPCSRGKDFSAFIQKFKCPRLLLEEAMNNQLYEAMKHRLIEERTFL